MAKNSEANVGNMLMFVVKFMLPLIIAIAGAIIYVNTKAENEAMAAGASVEKILTSTVDNLGRQNSKDYRVLRRNIGEIKVNVTKIHDNVGRVTAKQSAIEANISNINDRLIDLNEHLRHAKKSAPVLPTMTAAEAGRRMIKYEL